MSAESVSRQIRQALGVGVNGSGLRYPETTRGFCFLFDMPPFSACSGQDRTGHYMAALLVEAGFSVAMTHLCYFNPEISVRKKALPTDIAVYIEETREGNPTGAKRGCIWVDRYAAQTYANNRIRKDECLILYEKDFLDSVRAVCGHPLTEDDVVYLPHINPQWCFPGIKTIKNCLFGVEASRKRKITVNPPVPPGTVVIPHKLDIFRDGVEHDLFYSHQRTLAVLRASENFFTIDHNTAMSIEAALCGCRVWYLEIDGSAKEQFIDPEALRREVMNPIRDIQAARRFGNRVLDFFKDKA